MKTTNPPADTHQLACLEVWGGSSTADHAASVPGLDITVSSRPIEGSTAGGDLYLISSCSSGWISRMLLADVSGHGDGVAELSAKLRKAMHKSINVVDQSRLARMLNSAFEDISGGTKFATALLMTYYAPTGHLILVNAGHPPPLLCRAGSDQWAPIDKDTDGILTQKTKELRIGVRNLPLGVIGSTHYEQLAIKITKGDRICAYTDGYAEAQRISGELLGVDGLASVLSELPVGDEQDYASQTTKAILDRGYQLAEDDHTMLSFTHNGEGMAKVGMPTLANLIKNGFGIGHTDTIVSA
jgi:phosphoserine phosphatase RsbU/P